MDPIDPPSTRSRLGGMAHFLVVATVRVEDGHAGDALSLPRESAVFTAFDDPVEAAIFLYSEFRVNGSALGTDMLRHTVWGDIEVPRAMVCGRSPSRWLHDRPGEVLRRLGIRQGALMAAMMLDNGSAFAGDELDEAMAAPAVDMPGVWTARCGCAARRAGLLGAIPPGRAARIAAVLAELGEQPDEAALSQARRDMGWQPLGQTG